MLVAGGEYGYEVRQKLQHKDSIMDDINNDDEDADDDHRVRKNRNEKRKTKTIHISVINQFKSLVCTFCCVHILITGKMLFDIRFNDGCTSIML